MCSQHNHTARVAVHFNSIIERFTPHDTVFTVTSPSDLKETDVSAACSLHTALSSVSSSNSSLRRRRLQEIVEDGEDGPIMATANETSTHPRSVDEYREGGRALGKPYAEQAAEEKEEEEQKRIWRQEREAVRSGTARQGNVPATPAPSLHDRDGRDETGRNPDYIEGTAGAPRASSQSTRLPARDLYGAYVYKPKVKLGPRPSTETAGRPHTSGSSYQQTERRPISTLPAGIKFPSRRPMPSRPHSDRSPSNSSLTPIPSLPPKIPDLPLLSPIAIDSAMNEVATVTTNQRPVQPAPRLSAMTPEKQRLMKALELRKKQMALAAASKKREIETPNSPNTEPEDGADSQRYVGKTPVTSDQPTIGNFITSIRPGVENDEASGSPLHASSSPVSVLGPSEGLSTQASSFTDDNDHPTKDSGENDPELTTAPFNELEASETVMESKVSDLDSTEQAGSSRQMVMQGSPSSTPLPPTTDVEEHSLKEDEPAQVSLISNASLHAFVGKIESAVNYVTNVMHNIEGHTSDTRPSTAETLEQQSPPRPNKRRGFVDPIRILSSAENSDDNYLSDDSFMEELKRATVQEAKPVSVAKSPSTSKFPRSFPDRRPSDVGSASLSMSNPQQNGTLTQAARSSPSLLGHGYARSFSASSMDLASPQQAPGLIAKKINVSSGISRRIKALELVSSRETSPITQQSLPTAFSASSPSFTEFRKASLSAASGQSVSTGKQETRLLNKAPYPSPSPSPHMTTTQNFPLRSPSPDSPPQAKRARASEKSRPGSVSVTARILRGANNKTPIVPADASEPVAQDLYQSPLTIEHQRVTVPPSSHVSRKGSDTPSSPGSRNEPNSASATKYDPAGRRNSSSGRRRSEVGSPSNLVGVDERVEEKKESRRSRLLKRMSSISSSSRRSVVQALSPTLKMEDSIAESESIVESLPAVVDVGDVNIQFPDTLVRTLARRKAVKLR